jgi:predicted metal-dependent hydrolase
MNDERSAFILPRSALIAGIELFNAQKFWHAHEAWETPWLTAEGDARQFLQGLIQLAAAYHHVQRGTFRGGVRLFDAALRRLGNFPANYADVDRASAVATALVHRERIARGEQIAPEELPSLGYNS